MTELADKVLPKQYQRRIMDGGSCEGSAATAYGFPTIALAVPLILGFLGRDAISRLLGPEVWLGVALWAGSIMGLVNILMLLIASRR